MHSFQINTGPYKFHGAAEGSIGNPPILFLHGFLGSSLDWKNISEYLKDSYYCIAPDLPGHGKTAVNGRDELYSVKNTSSGIIDLLTELNINKPVLAGYSMGGRIALNLAVQYPQHFRAVVLESSSPGLATPAERNKRLEHDRKIAEKIRTMEMKKFLQFWYGQELFASTVRNSGFDRMLENRIHNIPEELIKSLTFAGTGAQDSLWGFLDTITIPIQIITGELDAKFNLIAKKMLEVNRKAQYTMVNGCGHTVHFENCTVFVRTVRRFVQTLRNDI